MRKYLRFKKSLFLGIIAVSVVIFGTGFATSAQASSSPSCVALNNSHATSAIAKQDKALILQFHAEVNSWGNAHLYHDTHDGRDYLVDTGYLCPGTGVDVDHAYNNAVTEQDFRQVLAFTQMQVFALHLLEKDYADQSSTQQTHQTDRQYMHHYSLMKSQVLVISLAEQTLRMYDQGKLVYTTPVVTGEETLPSPPGIWKTLDRLSPTKFISPYPKGSKYWYPPTKIKYAIGYHWGGYFVHDAWWRTKFGKDMEFPHVDKGGTQYAQYGSHGCINVPEASMKYIYAHTNRNTVIAIY
jgi:hypothetical protein